MLLNRKLFLVMLSISIGLGTSGCGTKSSSGDSGSGSTPVVAKPTVSSPTSPYTSSGDTLTLSGTCIDGYIVELSGDVVDSEVTTPLNSLFVTCSNSAFQFVITKGAPGTFTIYLRQVDIMGSISDPESFEWTYAP